MNPSPRTISGGELAVNALELMRRHNITQLIVLEKGIYTGVIHLHDLIREGFF
jgi:arabinose-5-phosphate isomerase